MSISEHPVNLTAQAFSALCKSNKPYLCSYCMILEQSNEILKLKETVAGLTDQIKKLEAKHDKHHVQRHPVHQTEAAPTPVAARPTLPINRTQSAVPNISAAERKFNIVTYGIKESPQNTNRQERMKHDLDCVLTSLAKTGVPIDSEDIKDLYRLGKYDSKNERPRPLLVKFLRSSVALDVLSNKTKLDTPVYLKPDLTPEERHKEMLLLKERRVLINKGVERKEIKIRNDSIFINNRFHCRVSDSSANLEFCTPATHDAENMESSSSS